MLHGVTEVSLVSYRALDLHIDGQGRDKASKHKKDGEQDIHFPSGLDFFVWGASAGEEQGQGQGQGQGGRGRSRGGAGDHDSD